MTRSMPPAIRPTRVARSALRRTRRFIPGWTRLDDRLAQGAALGAVIGVLAIVVKAGTNAVIGEDVGFILLSAAAVGAAWVAGLPAGIAATVVAAILNTVVFIAPELSSSGELYLSTTPTDVARVTLYVIAGVVVSVMVSSLRASRDELTTALEDAATLAAVIEHRDERLELVLDASRTGYWEWDIPSRSLVWSQAIFQQHGIDPAGGAPTYDRYLDSIHPDDRPTMQGLLDSALESGGSFSHEFRILWPDGSIHWTHGVGRVFLDARGQPMRMVGTGQDITERRRLEIERDRLVDEEHRVGTFREAFIDVISHELRTPITTILGLTQILTRPGRLSTDHDRVGLIGDVAAEAERLHRLVEDLLVLTRAERGEITIEAEPLELRRLLTRIAAREAEHLPGFAVELDLGVDLPIVAGEETYVEQIVRNMLGNAAKYAPAGGRVVIAAAQEGDAVAVRILDEGPGIDEEVSRLAFDLFYRSTTTARTVAGSGIGLFVCASLARAMGGTIWARRRPEGGSEFGFTLRAIGDDEPSLDPAATSGHDSPVGLDRPA